MTEIPASTNRLVLKSVALPSEHGGWGFLIEPILLGLLVAGSFDGLLLAVVAIGVFLIHQPLKIALKDRLKDRRPPRTIWAERFALAYGLMAFVPFVILLLKTNREFLLPILLAVPLASVQLYYDARNQGRILIPEICGGLALAMTAPAIAMLAGWTAFAAMILWVMLVLRIVPSILYVRARLKLEHGKPISPQLAWVAHAAAFIITGLVIARFASWPSVFAFGLLLIRALVGLSKYRKPRPAKIIGFQEVAYGLMTVIFVALGYRLPL